MVFGPLSLEYAYPMTLPGQEALSQNDLWKRESVLRFTKVKDVIAYYYDDHNALPKPLSIAYERAMRSTHIDVRPLDKKNLARDLEIILSIHSDAWSDNWGFIPFTARQAANSQGFPARAGMHP